VEVDRALKNENVLKGVTTTKWEGSNETKRTKILNILNKTQHPQLFSKSLVSSGHRLAQIFPLFKQHGHIISSLHLTFKPAMTQAECKQAMGNIWVLVTKSCTNLKTLKLDVPVKSYVNLFCSSHSHLSPSTTRVEEFASESLEKIQFLGSFILQFPDISLKLMKTAKDSVEVSVKDEPEQPKIKLEFWEFVTEAIKEIKKKVVVTKEERKMILML
jgi:hypothetical protein